MLGGHVEDEWAEYHQLLFDVRRSALYHDREEAWYARLQRLATGGSLLMGTAAVGSAVKEWALVGPIAGAVVAVLSASSLVFAFGESARKHSELRRRFLDLEARLTEAEPAAEVVRKGRADVVRIRTDCPPTKRYLSALVHNELVTALGYGTRTELPHRARLLAHLVIGPDLA